MAKPAGKYFSLSIEKAPGDFVEVRSIQPVEVEYRADGQGRAFICSPVPGRVGVEYVPDWFGITHFG